MSLVADVIDVETCEYIVTIYCRRIHEHAHFTLKPDAKGECVLDVSDWDVDERTILHNYLQQHRIRYDLERFFRPCDD